MARVMQGLSIDDIDRKPPIKVSFEIPYFTVSGIQVRYLKIVERSGYTSVSSCPRMGRVLLMCSCRGSGTSRTTGTTTSCVHCKMPSRARQLRHCR